MNAHSCIRASSTIKSPSKWNGIGKFWLYTALSTFGVRLTRISMLIPMSILCLANTSWYSSTMSSTACFSVFVRSVSVQSNRSRNFIRDSLSFFGFNFSFSFSSHSSLRILVCIALSSSVLPSFLVVANQQVLLCCFGLFLLSYLVQQVVKSGSHSGIIMRIALGTGSMNLDCSGVTTENSALCVFS